MIEASDVRFLPNVYAQWTSDEQRDYLRKRLANAIESCEAAQRRQLFLEERLSTLERHVRTAAAFVDSPLRVQ